MSFKFNPLTSNFDNAGSAGGASYTGLGTSTFDPFASGNVWYLHDDFLGYQAGQPGAFEWFNSHTGTGSFFNKIASDATSWGVFQSTCGNAVNNQALLASNILAVNLGTGGKELLYYFRLKLSSVPDATEEYNAIYGLSDTWPLASSQNNVAFVVDRSISTTNWVAQVESANVVNSEDTGVALSTDWVELAFKISADGDQVDYYINSMTAPVATITTGIPNGSGKEMGLMINLRKLAGTGTHTQYLDRVYGHVVI